MSKSDGGADVLSSPAPCLTDAEDNPDSDAPIYSATVTATHGQSGCDRRCLDILSGVPESARRVQEAHVKRLTHDVLHHLTRATSGTRSKIGSSAGRSAKANCSK